MRLDRETPSGDIEDRRGARRFGGGRLRIPMRGRRGGISFTGLAALLVVSWLLGVNPLELLNNGGLVESPAPPQQRQQPSAADAAGRDFVARVLGSTNRVWQAEFAKSGLKYEAPRLVLFTDAVESACGTGQAAMGPFYCPGDSRIYIDLSFFEEMKNRLGAPGDFAQAYVIAHEVGHHIQNELGLAQKVQAARRNASETEANLLSVRMELQADCYAGVWAKLADSSRQILEPGDIEEGLNAASQIGDDKLQKSARGYAVPDSFTHGSSAQRVSWFSKGYDTGNANLCDTFEAKNL
jgi:predicted metalloprotease